MLLESDADKLVQHEVGTDLQFVKKINKKPPKTKQKVSAKCNKMRYVCISLLSLVRIVSEQLDVTLIFAPL